jgi:hypothetical protein
VKSFIHALLIVLLVAGGAFSISSCKNKCGTTTCQNGGTCSNNACTCPTGFTGASCETSADAITIGTYDCSRANCTPAVGGVNAWKSSITAIANNGYQVDISNFDAGNITVVATVDTGNNIVIKPAAGTYGVNATGKYVNGVITLDFTTSYANGSYTKCIMTMKKE